MSEPNEDEAASSNSVVALLKASHSLEQIEVDSEAFRDGSIERLSERSRSWSRSTLSREISLSESSDENEAPFVGTVNVSSALTVAYPEAADSTDEVAASSNRVVTATSAPASSPLENSNVSESLNKVDVSAASETNGKEEDWLPLTDIVGALPHLDNDEQVSNISVDENASYTSHISEITVDGYTEDNSKVHTLPECTQSEGVTATDSLAKVLQTETAVGGGQEDMEKSATFEKGPSTIVKNLSEIALSTEIASADLLHLQYKFGSEKSADSKLVRAVPVKEVFTDAALVERSKRDYKQSREEDVHRQRDPKVSRRGTTEESRERGDIGLLSKPEKSVKRLRHDPENLCISKGYTAKLEEANRKKRGSTSSKYSVEKSLASHSSRRHQHHYHHHHSSRDGQERETKGLSHALKSERMSQDPFEREKEGYRHEKSFHHEKEGHRHERDYRNVLDKHEVKRSTQVAGKHSERHPYVSTSDKRRNEDASVKNASKSHERKRMVSPNRSEELGDATDTRFSERLRDKADRNADTIDQSVLNPERDRRSKWHRSGASKNSYTSREHSKSSLQLPTVEEKVIGKPEKPYNVPILLDSKKTLLEQRSSMRHSVGAHEKAKALIASYPHASALSDSSKSNTSSRSNRKRHYEESLHVNSGFSTDGRKFEGKRIESYKGDNATNAVHEKPLHTHPETDTTVVLSKGNTDRTGKEEHNKRKVSGSTYDVAQATHSKVTKHSKYDEKEASIQSDAQDRSFVRIAKSESIPFSTVGNAMRQAESYNKILEKEAMWKKNRSIQEGKHSYATSKHNNPSWDDKMNKLITKMEAERKHAPSSSSKANATYIMEDHKMEREVALRNKERDKIEQLAYGSADVWKQDKYYTEVKKTGIPWVNPIRIISKAKVEQPKAAARIQSGGSASPRFYYKGDASSSTHNSRSRGQKPYDSGREVYKWSHKESSTTKSRPSLPTYEKSSKRHQ